MSNFGKTIVLVIVLVIAAGGYMLFVRGRASNPDSEEAYTESRWLKQSASVSGGVTTPYELSFEYPDYLTVNSNKLSIADYHADLLEYNELSLYEAGTDASLKMISVGVGSSSRTKFILDEATDEHPVSELASISSNGTVFKGYSVDLPEYEMGVNEEGNVVGYIPTLVYSATSTSHGEVVFEYSNYKINNSDKTESERVEDFKKMVASFKFTN